MIRIVGKWEKLITDAEGYYQVNEKDIEWLLKNRPGATFVLSNNALWYTDEPDDDMFCWKNGLKG